MNQDERNLKHSDVLYDYIKFHLGLYIATAPVLAIVANGLGVADKPVFQRGMIALVAIYFIAGVHASWTIAKYVNVAWETDQNWADFEKEAGSFLRRFIHHYLYWIGLVFGLGSLFWAWWFVCPPLMI